MSVIRQYGIDRRDRLLTIGFHPDKKVRKGDIIKVISGKKYPKDTLYVVDYAFTQYIDNKDGTRDELIFIRCRGGEVILNTNCIVCAMSKGEDHPIRHYHKVQKTIKKRHISP